MPGPNWNQIEAQITRETNKVFGDCWTIHPLRARPNKTPVPDTQRGQPQRFMGQFRAHASAELFSAANKRGGLQFVEGSTNRPRLSILACDVPLEIRQEDRLLREGDGSAWDVHEIRLDHAGRVVLELSGPDKQRRAGRQ